MLELVGGEGERDFNLPEYFSVFIKFTSSLFVTDAGQVCCVFVISLNNPDE